MDAPVILSDAFWRNHEPQAIGGFAGKIPDFPALAGHVLFGTSGTTGAPKWLALSKDALAASARAVNAHLGVDAGSRWGLALPMHHVGGFGVVARAREAGCGFAAFGEKWNPLAFASWLDAQGITHTSLVPTQVHDLVSASVRAPRGPQAIVVGGGRLDVSTGQAARDLGWPVLASYGMTEASSQIATAPLAALEAEFSNAPLPLLPMWRVRCAADGRLEISGPCLFSGTLSHGGAGWHYEAREQPWFATSDLAQVNDAGITPFGRADSRVKILGELVDLEALEREIIARSGGLLSERNFALTALPDARAGSVLAAVCENTVPHEAAVDVLAAHAGEVPGFLRIQCIARVGALPRSPMGKLQRGKLAEIPNFIKLS